MICFFFVKAEPGKPRNLNIQFLFDLSWRQQEASWIFACLLSFPINASLMGSSIFGKFDEALASVYVETNQDASPYQSTGQAVPQHDKKVRFSFNLSC